MISVSSADLAQAAEAAVSIVPKRARAAVAGNLVLSACGSALTIASTNLEAWLSVTIPAKSSSAPFSAAVDGRSLVELAATLPRKAECAITLVDGTAVLTCDQVKHQLDTSPVTDLSEAPEINGTASVELTEYQAQRFFRQAVASASKEESRYYLGGLLLRLNGERLEACSCDGHGLIMVSADAVVDGDPDILIKGIIVPSKACAIIARMGATRIRSNGHLIGARTKDRVFISKLIDGTFPTYWRIIPKPSCNTAELGRAEFLIALQQLQQQGLTAGHRRPKARLDWVGDKVRLALAEIRDVAEISIVATTTGTAAIAFTTGLMIGLLRAIRADRIMLDLGDPSSAIRITAPGDDDLLALLTPIRL